MSEPSSQSAAAASSRPELLAPAGDWECLRAAIANGADAVYFGLSRFNARARASNFALDQLSAVVNFAHDHNVRAYVAFNTLIFPDELPDAAAYVAAIAEAGADAMIVQDLGLARLAARMAPALNVHASTQMTITEPTALVRLAETGVRRAILARELSLEAVARVAEGAEVELEVFVHGALCISYSGQCLASLTLGGRSANRGLCAQPCRLPYGLLVDGRPADSAGREYPLSPYDLAAHEYVAALARLGVAGLKIEGRLKGPHYVAAAVRMYRAAIDAAVGGEPFAPSDAARRAVLQSFSRGFTGGWLAGAEHASLVAGDSVGGRGLLAGRVTGKTAREVLIAPAEGCVLKAGDGVVFRAAGQQIGGRVYQVQPHGRAAVAAAFDGEFDISAVAVGGEVWKTDDPALEADLARTYSRVNPARRVPLRLSVRAEPGKPLRAVLADDAGREAQVESAGPVEPARRHSLTAALLAEQFGRLGDTPFVLAAVELFGPAGPADEVPVMAPKSVLNDLRRRSVEALLATRRAASRHAISEPDALARLLEEAACTAPGVCDFAEDGTTLSVLVRSLEQLRCVLGWQASQAAARLAMVWADLQRPGQAAAAVDLGARAGLPVGLAAPRICQVGEEAVLQALADAKPPAVLVRNLGALEFFRRALPAASLVGDFSLNAVNPLAADLLRRWGLARVTAGYDLNAERLATLGVAVPAGTLEVIVRSAAPMFHTRHCLYAANLGKAGGRASCGQPCERHSLDLCDRKDEVLSVQADASCRNTVFAPARQRPDREIAHLRSAGLRRFRAEFLHEIAAQLTDALDRLARLMS